MLVACIITSLVSPNEFDDRIDANIFSNNWKPTTILPRDKKNTNGSQTGEPYGENVTSAEDLEKRRYSETNELSGFTEQRFAVANTTSLVINDKTGDNGTDDAMLNKEARNTDKEYEVTEERHGPETTVRNLPAENVSLTSHPDIGSIDGERTVSTNESGYLISTEVTKEIISKESIDEPSEERGTEDSSTATSPLTRGTTVEMKSRPTNESSITTVADAQETTELNNTSSASEIPDDDNFMKEIEAAAFKLYVAAAAVFAGSLLVAIVVGLTLWTRRKRALKRELALNRMNQRSQIPQLEKLCSMAAFAAATDGADPSRTLTRTATVGRRPQGPRPAITAASMPLLSSSSTEDLAQIRKEMFGDVRTWAPERRVSNPPSRNFFK